MLFRYTHLNDTFLRALRGAVAAHRPATLCALLSSNGNRAFAKALSNLSGRVIADALSMLSSAQRAGVLKYLSRAARSRLCDAEFGRAHDSLYARTAAPSSPFFLLC